MVWQGRRASSTTPITGSKLGWPHDVKRWPGIHSLCLLKLIQEVFDKLTFYQQTLCRIRYHCTRLQPDQVSSALLRLAYGQRKIGVGSVSCALADSAEAWSRSLAPSRSSLYFWVIQQRADLVLMVAHPQGRCTRVSPSMNQLCSIIYVVLHCQVVGVGG